MTTTFSDSPPAHPAVSAPKVAIAGACAFVGVLVGAVVLIALPGDAAAQARDSVVEGPGYEVSEGTVLHPSAGLETGVTSNLFYEENARGPVAAPVIRLLGKLAVASQGNQPAAEEEPAVAEENAADEPGTGDDNPGAAPALDWRLGARLVLEQYVGSSVAVQDQGTIGGGFDAEVTTNPQGAISFVAKDSFTRATRAINYESRGQINRDINKLALGVDWHPGNRAIKIGGRYENLIDRFENSDHNFASRLHHLVRLRGEWQFLPITRFSLDASWGFFGGLGNPTIPELAKVSSSPLRVQAGIATLITELTSVKAHIGYGNGFYSAGENFHNVLAGAEFGYRYSPVGRFSVALDYGFADSINANFYRDFALIGKVDHQIGLLLLHGDAAVRLRGYRGIPMALGEPSREDLILSFTARAHYLYRDWLAFTGDLTALVDQTAYRYLVGLPGGGMTIDDPSFQRFDLTVGVLAAF